MLEQVDTAIICFVHTQKVSWCAACDVACLVYKLNVYVHIILKEVIKCIAVKL